MGKRAERVIDCCDRLTMMVLKNLIHVFICIGCIGFAFAISYGMSDGMSPRLDPYEIKVTRDMISIDQIMKDHKGLKPNSTAAGIASMTIIQTVNAYIKHYSDKSNFVMIHPLYVSLQKKSKLNMLLKEPFDIKDHEYDQEIAPIDGKTFYRNYMSKSLPCVFRKEVRKEKFFLDLKAAGNQQGVDKLLEENFKLRGPEFKKNIDFQVETTTIKRRFSKAGKF